MPGAPPGQHAAALCARLGQACSALVVRAAARADLWSRRLPAEGAAEAAAQESGPWCHDPFQLMLDMELDGGAAELEMIQ